ncbi:hypothetical protein PHYBLDRAFT_185390 [Phycomyces blakesleeanus NRRL 1555(-)]|uniref:Nudix hydrolase domain-containing protein n=2 Tax=Phycomyces blakesleeanus TaxID=4837 RepID=A0A167Q1V7_PHYB8|nr:hypothetical protein PHYBLDRAFT_185390 [Phycomyces blakesleeanus NRRL 1555(-)]OAD78918.1 hypothetical protein PHYBLDRAFT_185390 [Phycomyces blakesleeanus NRRL 1555(-)]|eukprot:XP_018296958.1 hypothetical protein PHYBLDRAFT_185390 [Phycomyces blakesleeanus NRRL 1555(-)]
MTHYVSIANQKVPITGSTPEILNKVLKFQPFKDWIQTFNKQPNEMNIHSIEIQSTDIFGSSKLGFVKFKADVRYKETGKNAPGIVFMRGGSVAVLIILKSEGKNTEDKVILTVQPRIAVPSLEFPELPAGMLDGSGQFSGVAAKEIEEETGLIIKDDELIDLTELAYGTSWRGVYPSAGGSDEFLRLFVCHKTLSQSDINELEGKLTGLRDHGENITLKLVDLKDAWKCAPDSKLLSTLALYDALKRENLV